jgi:CTP synthase
VVIFMPDVNPNQMGGTMRLGARKTIIREKPDGSKSLARLLYGDNVVMERHRHRYEVNPEKVQEIESAGLFFAGMCDQKQRMEIVELDRTVHPFYFACQFHPEFKSRPTKPSPPFVGLIRASFGGLEEYLATRS